MDIQVQLLNDLKNRAPSPKQFVEDLELLLSIERSAVYNRLNGTTRLTIDELLLILNRYQPSVNPFESVWPNRVLVDYEALSGNPQDFQSYMSPVKVILEKMLSLPNHHLYYAANELPFLHYFSMPELALFKYYVWSHFAWGTDGFEKTAFDQSFIDAQKPKDLGLFYAIDNLYVQIPSTEIWHTNLLNNTLNQIGFLQAIGMLHDADLADLLLSQIHQLLDTIENRAAHGYKSDTHLAPFRLYHNEVAFTNNVGLIQSSLYSAVHFAYDNPNFMSSVDQRLCTHTRKFIDNLITHSTLLSESSNKYRSLFFRRLRARLDQFQKELKAGF